MRRKETCGVKEPKKKFLIPGTKKQDKEAFERWERRRARKQKFVDPD